MSNTLSDYDRLLITDITDVQKGVMFKEQNPVRATGRYSDCFVYVIKGDTVYHFPNRSLEVMSGEIIHLPYGSTYTMHVKEPYEYIYVDFFFSKDGLDGQVAKNMLATGGLFEKMLRKWLKGSNSSFILCLSIMYEIFAQMLNGNVRAYLSGKSRAHISKAEDIIVNRLSDSELTVAEVARGVGITPTHLRRLFFAVYRVTPGQYIRQMRLKKAKALLLGTKYTMARIASETGFCGEYYFSRVFKSDTGIPPSLYRAEASI